MPRANRHFLPGYVWHITHRCHERQFLLKFVRDRRRWRHWLFEARKRFGLSVLNYAVTSNHVHLLVHDRGRDEIAQSMQLIAGRCAQEYNRRKRRVGAYWQDRYHATAVDTDVHLRRCLVYIDLNMVRAGAVCHPSEWDTCGHREIQVPPRRYAVIDRAALARQLGLADEAQLCSAHASWVDEALHRGCAMRDGRWTETLAVGRREFVERFRSDLGTQACHRVVTARDQSHFLAETAGSYAVFGP